MPNSTLEGAAQYYVTDVAPGEVRGELYHSTFADQVEIHVAQVPEAIAGLSLSREHVACARVDLPLVNKTRPDGEKEFLVSKLFEVLFLGVYRSHFEYASHMYDNGSRGRSPNLPYTAMAFSTSLIRAAASLLHMMVRAYHTSRRAASSFSASLRPTVSDRSITPILSETTDRPSPTNTWQFSVSELCAPMFKRCAAPRRDKIEMANFTK